MMSWIPHHHRQTHIHTHTLGDTHPINCSAFTVLPHVFFALSPGQLRGPWGHGGGLRVVQTPHMKVWGSFLLFCLCLSMSGGTSVTQCADLGVCLSGSRCGCLAVAHSHATMSPLRAPLPWADRRSSPAAQLAALYQFNQPRSPTINQ